MDDKKTGFDIAALAATDEGDLDILDGKGNPTGWIWTFAGPGHPTTIALDRESNARFLQREQAKERVRTNGKTWKGDSETVDEVRDRNVAYIVGRLLRWSDTQMEGKPFPCTPENARRILSDPRFGLVFTQANEFLRDEKDFTKGSAKP